MITSITEINEVNAAKVNEPKNNTPNTSPNGALLIIVGNAKKAKPIPPFATSLTSTPCAVAMKPNAANTPIPASTSKLEFAKPTTKPLPVKSESFFKYDAYVIIIPKQIEREKKI